MRKMNPTFPPHLWQNHSDPMDVEMGGSIAGAGMMLLKNSTERTVCKIP
jgi:hypothetical protein